MLIDLTESEAEAILDAMDEEDTRIKVSLTETESYNAVEALTTSIVNFTSIKTKLQAAIENERDRKKDEVDHESTH